MANIQQGTPKVEVAAQTFSIGHFFLVIRHCHEHGSV
jgi:hypothetical protein